jgi:hypothetical protein
MKILDSIKNNFLYGNKYKTNSEAIIISCYFNPQNNPYRVTAFNTFYESIKHLNHHIIECVIGDAKPQLPENDNISRIHTPNLLWHKESLLNLVVSKLDPKYKYVFWIDADVIFTNKNWLVESVQALQTNRLVQPFEYCVHLDQDEISPRFNLSVEKEYASIPNMRHPKLWKSFGANHAVGNSGHSNYDVHGHVGFAWGARREVLDAVPLYDRALVGGADHIIAHAGAGQFCHSCITKAFGECTQDIEDWSRKFYSVVRGRIGYVQGDLYHIWHGDVEKRQYLKRVQEFTPTADKIRERDANGLHVTHDDSYVKKYFDEREVKTITDKAKVFRKTVTNRTKLSTTEYNTKRAELIQQYPNRDNSFIESLMWGYIMDDGLMGGVIGGNMMGGIVGDMLNNNDQPSVTQQLDTMLNDNRPVSDQLDSMLHTPTDTTDYTTSNNFS